MKFFVVKGIATSEAMSWRLVNVKTEHMNIMVTFTKLNAKLAKATRGRESPDAMSLGYADPSLPDLQGKADRVSALL